MIQKKLLIIILFLISVSAVSASIQISTGWNMFSPVLNPTNSGTERNISLSQGWNLIGYSGNDPFYWYDAEVTKSGEKKSIEDAATAEWIVSTIAHFNDGMYEYVSEGDSLTKEKGYWVNALKDNLILTLPGVGGSLADNSYYWYDAEVTKGVETKTIGDAALEGWIQAGIYYFDSGYYGFVPIDDDNIYPWRGYWLRSWYDLELSFGNNVPTIDNIVIDGQDASATVVPNAGKTKTVSLAVEASDDDGYRDIISVICSIIGPGTVEDSPVKLSEGNKIDSSTMNYTGSFDMDFYDVSGDYTVDCEAFDGDGTATDSEDFEYLESIALELDTELIGFGNLNPLETRYVYGDTDMETLNNATIKNIGNVEIHVNISGSDLTNGSNVIDVGEVEYRFDDGKYEALTKTLAGVDLNLAVDSMNKVDFRLKIPNKTPKGSYSGEVTIIAE